MVEKKPDQTRGFLSFGLIIIAGIILGKFLKNIEVGLIIGLVLGLLGSNLLRRR